MEETRQTFEEQFPAIAQVQHAVVKACEGCIAAVATIVKAW